MRAHAPAAPACIWATFFGSKGTDCGLLHEKEALASNWHISCFTAYEAGRRRPAHSSGGFQRMKKIEAIIKPFKLDEVKEALQ
ncbi:MAG: hypothetical protein JJ937_17920, partial [Parvibaculum sp.]|nr:hypothetical protein [Parvibaculum sp.]